MKSRTILDITLKKANDKYYVCFHVENEGLTSGIEYVLYESALLEAKTLALLLDIPLYDYVIMKHNEQKGKV